MAKNLQILSMAFVVRNSASDGANYLQDQSRNIRAILDSVSSGHVLHTIQIELAYWVSFSIGRAELLTIFFATHVVEGIRRLRPYHKLRQLVFTFIDKIGRAHV